jgi:predicted Zn-ribbon and HTH transcriptional regulator
MGDMYCSKCHRCGVYWVALGSMNEHTRCPHCEGINCQQIEEENDNDE